MIAFRDSRAMIEPTRKPGAQAKQIQPEIQPINARHPGQGFTLPVAAVATYRIIVDAQLQDSTLLCAAIGVTTVLVVWVFTAVMGRVIRM